VETHKIISFYATAITIGVRILGPALGFILGSLCTMVYADLSRNPQITPTDPRWVGAWWLGKLDECKAYPKAPKAIAKTSRSLQEISEPCTLMIDRDSVKRVQSDHCYSGQSILYD